MYTTFKDVPLKTAIEQLRSMTGMNIVADLGALAAEGVSLDLPINLKVDNISMKSALKILLDQLKLTYVVQDEVLKITTDRGARGKLVQKVYSVAERPTAQAAISASSKPNACDK